MVEATGHTGTSQDGAIILSCRAGYRHVRLSTPGRTAVAAAHEGWRCLRCRGCTSRTCAHKAGVGHAGVYGSSPLGTGTTIQRQFLVGHVALSDAAPTAQPASLGFMQLWPAAPTPPNAAGTTAALGAITLWLMLISMPPTCRGRRKCQGDDRTRRLHIAYLPVVIGWPDTEQGREMPIYRMKQSRDEEEKH